MNIEVFSLCDAATIENGKLNMLGAFDTIMAEKVPLVHPLCTIALRLRFNASEGMKHGVAVKLVDADGTNVIPPANGTLNVRFAPNQISSSANLVLNLQGLKLAQIGEYSIDLAVNGKSCASIPLYVKRPHTTS